jgi:hypothetical protein
MMIHQDWAWLIAVKRMIGELAIVKSREELVHYGREAASITRSSKWQQSLEWANCHLRDCSPRVRGDFAAVIAGNLARVSGEPQAVVHCLLWAIRHGRPGIRAVIYASVSVVRAVINKAWNRTRKTVRPAAKELQ